MSYLKHKVPEALEDLTDGDGGDVTLGSVTLKGHILPAIHASGHPDYPGYDIGAADKKIRHIFLSDNSLWIGDTHRLSIHDNQIGFKKRTKSTPEKVQQIVQSWVEAFVSHVMSTSGSGTLTLDGTDYNVDDWGDGWDIYNSVIAQAFATLGYGPVDDAILVSEDQWAHLLWWLRDNGLNNYTLADTEWGPVGDYPDAPYYFNVPSVGHTATFDQAVPDGMKDVFGEKDFGLANNFHREDINFTCTPSMESSGNYICPIATVPYSTGVLKVTLHLFAHKLPESEGTPTLVGHSVAEAQVIFHHEDGGVSDIVIETINVNESSNYGGTGVFSHLDVNHFGDPDQRKLRWTTQTNLVQGLVIKGTVIVDASYIDPSITL